MKVIARIAPPITRRPLRRCLNAVDVLVVAVSPAPEETFPSLAHHAGKCRACGSLISAVRSIVEDARFANIAIPHLDELDIAKLLDRSITPARDDSHIAHLATCTTCRGAFVAVRGLLNDPSIHRELTSIQDSPERVSRSRSPNRSGWAIASIAAVAVAIISMTIGNRHASIVDDGEERWRAIGAAPPTLRFAVVRDDARPDTLRWSSVSQAVRYRVVVLDAEGRDAWSTEVSDTFAVLPNTQMPKSKDGYFWRVRAETSSSAWHDTEYSGIKVPPQIKK
jgi:hypothetical protein